MYEQIYILNIQWLVLLLKWLTNKANLKNVVKKRGRAIERG